MDWEQKCSPSDSNCNTKVRREWTVRGPHDKWSWPGAWQF